MARVMTQKTPARRRRKPRARRKRPGLISRINLRRVAVFLALLTLLFFSVGVVGYVVFFRTVVAAELGAGDRLIMFEEPDPPRHPEVTGGGSTEGREQLPRVALIIDDMGYHREVGEALLALDLNLTFSFLPHAPFTAELEEAAYQAGRSVLLHLPLEPRSPEWDPGPGALALADDVDSRRAVFDADLLLVPHATGVNNHMGSLYTENETAMAQLAGMLAERELFFIDSYTTAASTGLAVAARFGVPAARRHVFVDNVLQVPAVCAQLEKLVGLAEHQGWAIGIGHPYPETLDSLRTCGETILSRIELVAVDELVQ